MRMIDIGDTILMQLESSESKLFLKSNELLKVMSGFRPYVSWLAWVREAS